MKLPYSLLKEYVNHRHSPEELGHLLTMTGFELEEIIEIAGEPVLDVNIMANRGDGASILGLVREILAKDPEAKPTPLTQTLLSGNPLPDDESRDLWSRTGITIQTDHCTRYACRIFTDVVNGPSPEWLVKKLELLGQRSINLLVDLTNLVMFETGQPLHAFDLDKLAGERIVVRLAEPGETFVTLDEIERTLTPGQMLICDAEKPVAIAGVMGGLHSEVSATTTRCLLESAHFVNTSVRRTRKELGLQTEASYRFERSVDPAGVVRALNRFADLYQQITGKAAEPGVADAWPTPPTEITLTLRLKRCRELLGMPVTRDEAVDYLSRLGCTVTEHPETDSLEAVIPSWRTDLLREEDLIEEVGRVHGYERIPERLPIGSTPIGGAAAEELFVDTVREVLLSLGFNQAISHSLRAPHPLDAPGTNHIALRDPGSPEHSHLRNSILPNLCDAALRNGTTPVAVFETGKVFPGLTEHISCGILLSGDRTDPSWTGRKPVPADFFTLKGHLENLYARVRRTFTASAPASPDPRLHPTRQAAIPGGIFGQIHPDLAEQSGLHPATLLAEINLELLYEASGHEPVQPVLHRNPAVRRDISFVISKEVPFSRIELAIQNTAGELLERVWLFDVYSGDNLPFGTQSLAIALQLRKAGNFTDEEANQVRDQVVQALERLGAKLR